MANTMTSVDFMTGILAGLALRGETVLDLSDTRVDKALAAVYRNMLDRVDTEELDIDFQIIPDTMHGDSTVVQDAITSAIGSRLAGRINPSFRRIRITIDYDWASALTGDLPGGKDLYLELVDDFLKNYLGVTIAP